jgi:fumarate reductase flavoprotein subunit
MEISGSNSEIIVVGAGGCGLAAALATAESGAHVLILEKTDKPGGGTALSSRGLRAAGTRFQREKGIEDSPARYAQDILRRNGGQSDVALTERLTQISAEMAEWLADRAGIEFEIGTHLFGHSTRRGHSWRADRTIIDYLMDAVDRSDNIRILFSTGVGSLKLDADGAVIGVVTQSGVITGRKVILATGGFGASRELLSQYIPQAVDIPFPGHYGSTGDGLQMGMAVGAATENLGAFQPFPTRVGPEGLWVPPVVATSGAIVVDKHGRRFIDETQFPGGIGAKMLTLPGKQAFEIFDQRIYQSVRNHLADVIAAMMVKKAETAAELAYQLGVDAAGLERTIQEYNSAAEVGKDAFGRTVSVPMNTPLYGVKVRVALYHTQGGLKVNINAQVLRPDGLVIPNLYAGGGAATGISGPGPEGYLPGNGLLASLGLGKIAGEHAAKSLKSPPGI